MKWKNLISKYGLTVDEIKSGVDTVAKGLSKICNVTIAIAVTDLLTSGDIPEEVKT